MITKRIAMFYSKKRINACLLLAACLTLAGLLRADVPRPSALPDVVNYVLNCFAEAQKEKKLVLVEKLVEIDSCSRIQKLGFFFDLYDTVDALSGRRLITGLVSDFLNTLKQNEKVVPYLSCHFSEKNVAVRLRVRNTRCGFVYPPLGNIAFVSALDGMIIYDTLNSYTYDLDTWRVESYEKAVRLATDHP